MASVPVTNQPTRLDAPSSSPYKAGGSVAIANMGAQQVFLGGAEVTPANGFPLAAGASISLDLRQGGALYGIVASGTCECRTLQVAGI